MVIRVISVPDSLDLPDFDEVFRTVLGWDNLGFICRVHGQEYNSFRRATRSKTLGEFQLRPSETFLHTCWAIDLWEWEFRLLDLEPGADDDMPLCLGGRGAAPPEHCGGPTGYRLMLKRQRQGEAMCTPLQMEAVIGMLAASNPDEPANKWQTLRQALDDGFHSIDRKLKEYGPLEPELFSLEEANQRLAQRRERMRFRA
jgi:Plasmid pRiA4b ORF-3-like protein